MKARLIIEIKKVRNQNKQFVDINKELLEKEPDFEKLTRKTMTWFCKNTDKFFKNKLHIVTKTKLEKLEIDAK